jgi:streptogramin lyase
MKFKFITFLALVLSIQVNAQRSLYFEVFTNSFFYQNQEINTNKKINSNDIRLFYLRGDDTWMFLHANGSIQKSNGGGFININNSAYRENPSYSKESVTYFFPVSEKEYYVSTGKELIHVKPDNTSEFLSSEKEFRMMKQPKLNIVQLTAASKNNNGEVFLAGLSIARKETGIEGVTAGLTNKPNGIFKIIDGNIDHFNPVPGKTVNKLVCSGNGITWAATDKELLKYENGTWNVFGGQAFNLSNYTIKDIYVDAQNRLWIATDIAVGEFSSEAFNPINVYEGNDDIRFQTIHVDDNNLIWLGTRNHGVLMIWDDFETQYYRSNSPVSSNSIHGIFSTGNNNKIFISKSNGITTLKIDKRYFSNEYKTLSGFNSKDDFGYRAFQSYNGNLYSLKGSKLYKVVGNEYSELEIYNEDKLVNFVQNIAFDSKGNIWAATNHNLKKFDGNTSKTFETDKKIASKQILQIAIDKNDHVWVGSKAGLAKFDGTNWIGYNKKNSALPDNNIKTIFCDSKNNIWVGSKNWLAVIKDGNFTVYDKKSSEIGKAGVYKIQEANNGDLWMIAGNSIAKYSNGEFVFIEEFNRKYPGNIILHQDYLLASASSNGITRYNTSTNEFRAYKDIMLSTKTSGMWLVNDEIWIQTYDPKQIKSMSPTEKQAYDEQRKKIPKEHLRITDNDEDFHFEYMLVKFPVDKFLQRK